MATKNKTQASTATAKGPGTAEINRKRKLLKQLKLQPNNEQVKDAITNIKYRRKTPKGQEWSKTDITIAKLFKEFSGRADWDLFSSNPKVQAAAISKHSTKSFHNLPQGKVSFTLGARAHDGAGILVWA